jgi:hypothetical protein
LAGAPQQAGSINTLPAAGPNRPANVPDGYVVTPAGYFDPSCVRSLAKGERLLADGRVQHVDGTVDQNAAVCNFPRYTQAGIPFNGANANTIPPQSEAGTKSSPEVNGWIENASIVTWSAATSYGAVIAVWTVPPQPVADDGQVLYFFPGLEDINSTQSILQPVLQWFHKQWAIASWNCCLNGITTESPVVNVSPGDEIYGSITSGCSPGIVSCAIWNVLSLDLLTGESTTLSDTPSDGQVFNWAFGGVLEAYAVVACNDYPQDRKIAFHHIAVFDENLHRIVNPIWGEGSNLTQTPQCHYGVESKPDQVTLDY